MSTLAEWRFSWCLFWDWLTLMVHICRPGFRVTFLKASWLSSLIILLNWNTNRNNALWLSLCVCNDVHKENLLCRQLFSQCVNKHELAKWHVDTSKNIFHKERNVKTKQQEKKEKRKEVFVQYFVSILQTNIITGFLNIQYIYDTIYSELAH